MVVNQLAAQVRRLSKDDILRLEKIIQDEIKRRVKSEQLCASLIG